MIQKITDVEFDAKRIFLPFFNVGHEKRFVNDVIYFLKSADEREKQGLLRLIIPNVKSEKKGMLLDILNEIIQEEN